MKVFEVPSYRSFSLYLLILCSHFFLFSCAASKNRVAQRQNPYVSNRPLEPSINIPKPEQVRARLIVIDPGHGGEDPGARSKMAPFLIEKQLTLYTAKETASRLRAKGYRVVMTRVQDQTVGLFERVHFAERRRADLFVSIHFNACPKPDVRGIEVYYFKNRKTDARQKDSHRVGKLVLDQVSFATSSPSRGVRHGNFCVVRETKMPAILVEGGYLTSPIELKRLSSKAYMQKIAFGIAQGIDEYFKTDAQ